jgi:hypothetical protein
VGLGGQLRGLQQSMGQRVVPGLRTVLLPDRLSVVRALQNGDLIARADVAGRPRRYRPGAPWAMNRFCSQASQNRWKVLHGMRGR